MRRGYSIYDSYGLSNSSAIPIFTGSANPEMIQVAANRQNVYDAALQGAQYTGESLNDIVNLEKDTPIANQLRQGVNSKLDEYAKREDYENLLPAVSQLARQTSQRMRELYAPYQQYQDFVKKLDDKDLNYNSQQKATLRAMAMDEYQGLSVDPTTGRLQGAFNGTQLDKNINIQKKVDDAMQGYADAKGGTITESSDGTWILKVGNKWEKLTPERINTILESNFANDPEYHGYVEMVGRMAGYRGKKLWNNPNNFQEGPSKNAVLEMAKKTGLPLSEVGAQYMANTAMSDVMNQAKRYATTKYAHNNVWTERSMSGDPFAVARAAKPDPEIPFVMQGPAFNPYQSTTPTDPAEFNKQFQDNQANIQGMQTELNTINQRLRTGNMTPAARQEATSKKESLERGLSNAQFQNKRFEDYQNTVRERTAREMGTTYDELLNSEGKKLETDIGSRMKGTKYQFQGQQFTGKQIADAIKAGNYSALDKRTVDENGIPKYEDHGIKVTINGKTIPITASMGGIDMLRDAAKYNQNKGEKMKAFDSRYANNFKSMSQDFTPNTTSITMPEEKAKNLRAGIQNNIGAFDFYKDGKVVSEGDKPINFTPHVNVLTSQNGETWYQMQAADEKGQPTGDFYTVISKNDNGNTIASQVARNRLPIAKDADMERVAQAFDNGSWSRYFTGEPLDAKIPVPKAPEGTYITRVRMQGPSGANEIFYKVVDPQGNTITGGDGKPLLTNQTSVIDRWQRQLAAKK